MKKGFTLMELLAVIVIIGILATISMAYYFPSRELALDREVFLNLKTIQSAQRTRRMDTGAYYPTPLSPPAAAVSVAIIANINQNLRLSLSEAATRSWNYAVWNNGCAQATRNGDNGRSWYIIINDPGDPLPGTCP